MFDDWHSSYDDHHSIFDDYHSSFDDGHSPFDDSFSIHHEDFISDHDYHFLPYNMWRRHSEPWERVGTGWRAVDWEDATALRPFWSGHQEPTGYPAGEDAHCPECGMVVSTLRIEKYAAEYCSRCGLALRADPVVPDPVRGGSR